MSDNINQYLARQEIPEGSVKATMDAVSVYLNGNLRGESVQVQHTVTGQGQNTRHDVDVMIDSNGDGKIDKAFNMIVVNGRGVLTPADSNLGIDPANTRPMSEEQVAMISSILEQARRDGSLSAFETRIIGEAGDLASDNLPSQNVPGTNNNGRSR